MFERYYEEGSEWIPRGQLSTITRRNLRYLERELGYQFDDQARKAQFGWAPSYLIYGTNPQGDEVVYERRETGGRAAGQTFLWEGGKRTRPELPALSATSFTQDWRTKRDIKLVLGEVDFSSLTSEELRNLWEKAASKEEQDVISRWVEGIDLSELDPSERLKLLGLIKTLDEPRTSYWFPGVTKKEGLRKGLSREEKKELKELLDKYRQELEA